MSTTWTITLGRFSTGRNLVARFLDASGVVVGTGTVEAVGNGRYICTADAPRGAVVIAAYDTDRDEYVQVGPLAVVFTESASGIITLSGTTDERLVRWGDELFASEGRCGDELFASEGRCAVDFKEV